VAFCALGLGMLLVGLTIRRTARSATAAPLLLARAAVLVGPVSAAFHTDPTDAKTTVHGTVHKLRRPQRIPRRGWPRRSSPVTGSAATPAGGTSPDPHSSGRVSQWVPSFWYRRSATSTSASPSAPSSPHSSRGSSPPPHTPAGSSWPD